MKSKNVLGKKRKRTQQTKNDDPKTIEILTINELHEKAKKLFNEKKYDNYEELEKNVINIYDLDEEINLEYLKLLNSHYKKNKSKIDSDNSGLSDKIANNFYNYIFTLKLEDRLEIYTSYDYFKENEIFHEDEKYFHNTSTKHLFHEMISKIIKLDEINDPSEKFIQILDSYSFPAARKKKIPSIFGNEEFRYVIYIMRIDFIFNLIKKRKTFSENKIEFIRQIISSISTFKYYLLLDVNQYDEEYIRYIIFCIESIFLYCNDINKLKTIIDNNLSLCSAFLYEEIKEKKDKLKLIEDCIINDNFNLDTIDFNTEIKIKYLDKIYQFKVSDYYFSYCRVKKDVINIIINNRNHSFSYYLENNRILEDELLLNKYDNYYKKILNSQINKEYIRKLEGIDKYNFVFDEEKFLDEIKVQYAMMPMKELSGLTNKDFYTVYINNNLDKSEDVILLAQLGGRMVVKLHEIVNHIYRVIIHANDKDIPLDTPLKIYKDKKTNSRKKLKDLNDAGDKYEVMLFGDKLNKFYFSAILFLFNEKNWNNLDISKFSKAFKKHNVFQKNMKILQNKLVK